MAALAPRTNPGAHPMRPPVGSHACVLMHPCVHACLQVAALEGITAADIHKGIMGRKLSEKASKAHGRLAGAWLLMRLCSEGDSAAVESEWGRAEELTKSGGCMHACMHGKGEVHGRLRLHG